MAANQPKLRAYTVNNYGSGPNRSARWTEIGAAWETPKGNLRIQLEAVPVNGQIILMEPKPKDDETADKAADSKTETEPETVAKETEDA